MDSFFIISIFPFEVFLSVQMTLDSTNHACKLVQRASSIPFMEVFAWVERLYLCRFCTVLEWSSVQWSSGPSFYGGKGKSSELAQVHMDW